MEGMGRGWGGRLSPETRLLAESGLIMAAAGIVLACRRKHSAIPPPRQGTRPETRPIPFL